MKRLIYTLIAVLVIIIVVAIAIISKNSNTSSNVSGDIELQKITLSEVTHSVFYAPQYVAINLGFFKDEGLDIELINSGGADKVMTAVLSNDVQIGLAGPEATVYVYNEGSSDYAEVFAQLTKRDGSFLVSRNSGDFNWTDLKGKHILPGRKGGMPYMTFEYVLKNNNIDTVNDLNLDTSISFDAMTSAFVSGTGDYVTVYEPTATQLELEGKGHIVASVGAATEEMPFTAYFAKKSYIEKNPEIIQKFTNAIYKGQVWVQNHNAKEIAEAMIASFPDSDVEVLTKVVQRYKEIDAWKNVPTMTEDAFNRLQEVMTLAGELDKTAPYNVLVNNTFAEKATKH